MTMIRSALLCLLVLLFLPLGSAELSLAVDDLPPASGKAPVPADHFPDAFHAAVFRNWGLVPPQRLADALETTPEILTEVATSMGLPGDVVVPPEMASRGYITLVRRNWHLLPFDQLLTLLDVSAEDFAQRLREDDFLIVKLGNLKPDCPRVVYQVPTEETKQRVARIRSIVQQNFGAMLKMRHEPRFQFIRELSQDPGDSSHGDGGNVGSDYPRFIYSYFAMFGDPLSDPALDPFPDGLLSQLQKRGVNGVWLHVVLRDLAPPSVLFPDTDGSHRQRLKNLDRLVQRAKKYNIDVYLYVNEPRAMPERFYQDREHLKGVPDPGSPVPYFALCTSNIEVRNWVSDSLAFVFEKVPDLGGVFTITASENLTNCWSKFNATSCPRCRDRSASDILVEINQAIAEGVHRSAPDAKVIAWDWGWAGHGDASDTIARLPKDVWLMSVSEWNLPVERGGVKATVGEYSISAVGPGPRASKHWQVAQQHGLKTVAKVQFNITWEMAAVPYLPVMNLIAQHNANLAKANLDGQMLSWSLGGYPSPNLQLAEYFARQPNLSVDQALDKLANETYGEAGASDARQAWTAFSEGYAQYPYAGMYTGPQHVGPANLLYAQSTGYWPGMVCFPYDHLQAWSQPFPADVYAQQFQKVADGFARGLGHLEAAAAAAPADKQAFVAQDLNVARAATLHFQSVPQQVQFILARDQFHLADNPSAKSQWRVRIAEILDREIATAVALYPVAASDSRIGYEASNHYFYVPQDLIEKVINCEYLKERLAERSPDQE